MTAPSWLTITEDYQDKDGGNQKRSIHGNHLTCYHGIKLSQPRSNGAGLLLDRMKSGLRSPEMDLELATLLSRLGVAVLSRPPLPEEVPGIIAIVRIGGIR